MIRIYILLIFCLTHSLTPVYGLTIEKFLQQVKTNHKGYLSALSKIKAAKLNNFQANLLYSSVLFAHTQHEENAFHKNILAQKRLLQSHTYQTIGIDKNFTTSLNAKLFYKFDKGKRYDSSLNLQLQQPLLDNSISTKKNIILTNNQMRKFAEEFKALKILIYAEECYWRLAFLQKIVNVHQDSVSKSKQIYLYNKQKRAKNFVDESDVLQAKASLDLKKLELSIAQNEFSSAQLDFNSVIEMVAESQTALRKNAFLSLITIKSILLLTLPKRGQYSLDILSAEQVCSLTNLQVQSALEKINSTLDLLGGVAISGHNSKLAKSLRNSYTTRNTSSFIGLKFSLPLDRQSVNQINQGYKQDAIAAKLLFQRQSFERNNLWQKLAKNFFAAKEKLKIAINLAEAQKLKLVNEEKQQKHGRTTTHKILLFEQEYLDARIQKLNIALEILILRTQLKTFGTIDEYY